jgi:hypothetical protein
MYIYVYILCRFVVMLWQMDDLRRQNAVKDKATHTHTHTHTHIISLQNAAKDRATLLASHS